MPFAKKNFVAVIVLVAIAAALYGWVWYNKKPASLVDASPTVTVAAETLVQEYTSNETAANEKYLGKTIDVAGTVSAAGMASGIVLGNGTQKVACLLDSTVAATTAMPVVGSTVKLRGICTGFLMDVELNRCVLLNK